MKNIIKLRVWWKYETLGGILASIFLQNRNIQNVRKLLLLKQGRTTLERNMDWYSH